MKINKHQQRGSIMMLVFSVVILLFIIALFIKVIPVYMDNMAIATALDKVHEELSEQEAVRDKTIRKVFLNALIPQNVNVINGQNYEDAVSVQRTDEGFEMMITYERIVPLLGNASLLFEFEQSIEVP
ncbi:hypothetical protein PN36_01525 [Candidatus Thiomargarita nelsonii]|uniref:DUF4845 domain-containing protein n=1 Tax=Candidatus Thiomargarita nelsonii TaxID=1003181 RepID=A0A0A6PFI1_9GAMM|nr:hypothetical protein PN36_01525 [Candidatus Thiomargarita nelsonii]